MKIINQIHNLFTSKQVQNNILNSIEFISLQKQRQNYDFEVVSKSVFDIEGNEYLNIEEYHEIRFIDSILKFDIEEIDDQWYVIEKENHTILSNGYHTKKASEAQLREVQELWLENDTVFLTEDYLKADYGIRLDKKIDFNSAKLCGFGIVRIMNGEHQDEQFLYPITDSNVPIQFLAYLILTSNNIHIQFEQLIRREDFKLVVGETVHTFILEKLRKKAR